MKLKLFKIFKSYDQESRNMKKACDESIVSSTFSFIELALHYKSHKLSKVVFEFANNKTNQ